MNAFKRYCKNTLGIKPESEYPCMPFEVSPGIVLDSITIDAEEATVTTVYNVLVDVSRVTRGGQLESVYTGSYDPRF